MSVRAVRRVTAGRDAAGLGAGQIVLVGDDRVNDCEGARAAGMHAVLPDPRRREPVPEEARIGRLGDLVAS